jgi:hypothetical protein
MNHEVYEKIIEALVHLCTDALERVNELKDFGEPDSSVNQVESEHTT